VIETEFLYSMLQIKIFTSEVVDKIGLDMKYRIQFGM